MSIIIEWFQSISSDTVAIILATLLIPALFSFLSDLSERMKNRNIDRTLLKKQLNLVYLPLVHLLQKERVESKSEARNLYSKLHIAVTDENLTPLIPQYLRDEVESFGVFANREVLWERFWKYGHKLLKNEVLREYYSTCKKLGYPQPQNFVIETWHRFRMNVRAWLFNLTWILALAVFVTMFFKVFFDNQSANFISRLFQSFFGLLYGGAPFVLTVAVALFFIWVYFLLLHLLYWVLAIGLPYIDRVLAIGLPYIDRIKGQKVSSNTANRRGKGPLDKQKRIVKKDWELPGVFTSNLITDTSPCAEKESQQNKNAETNKKYNKKKSSLAQWC